mmetsp:Transcript_2056/g.5757  ORF Transcript_2056/g.5757 Transcript_2056/m.5757 type:complete len:311 (-) Transcript_2056:1572-2504(-)
MGPRMRSRVAGHRARRRTRRSLGLIIVPAAVGCKARVGLRAERARAHSVARGRRLRRERASLEHVARVVLVFLVAVPRLERGLGPVLEVLQSRELLEVARLVECTQEEVKAALVVGANGARGASDAAPKGLAAEELGAEGGQEAAHLVGEEAEGCRRVSAERVGGGPEAVRVVQHGDEHLHRQGRGHHGQARPRHRALLVERPVARAVSGRHDVVAKIAPKARRVVCIRGGCDLPRRRRSGRVPGAAGLDVGRRAHGGPPAVAHDHVGVKAEGRGDCQAPLGSTEKRGQPARLARVCEEEDRVVRLHQRV